MEDKIRYQHQYYVEGEFIFGNLKNSNTFSPKYQHIILDGYITSKLSSFNRVFIEDELMYKDKFEYLDEKFRNLREKWSIEELKRLKEEIEQVIKLAETLETTEKLSD